MALSKEAPEFDFDDEVLLMEPAFVLEEVLNEEPEAPIKRAKPKSATALKQHKYIDYTRALDATQLYLNEIGFSPLLTPEEEVHFARLAQKGDPAGRVNAFAHAFCQFEMMAIAWRQIRSGLRDADDRLA